MSRLPEQELLDLRRERDAWKGMAAYFADVLAASAGDLLQRRSLSAAERRRQVSICQTAITSLNADRLTNGIPRPIASVAESFARILADEQQRAASSPPSRRGSLRKGSTVEGSDTLAANSRRTARAERKTR